VCEADQLAPTQPVPPRDYRNTLGGLPSALRVWFGLVRRVGYSSQCIILGMVPAALRHTDRALYVL